MFREEYVKESEAWCDLLIVGGTVSGSLSSRQAACDQSDSSRLSLYTISSILVCFCVFKIPNVYRNQWTRRKCHF